MNLKISHQDFTDKLLELGGYKIKTANSDKHSYGIFVPSKGNRTIVNDYVIDYSNGLIKKGFVSICMFSKEFGSLERLSLLSFESLEEAMSLIRDIKLGNPEIVLHRINQIKCRNLLNHQIKHSKR